MVAGGGLTGAGGCWVGGVPPHVHHGPAGHCPRNALPLPSLPGALPSSQRALVTAEPEPDVHLAEGPPLGRPVELPAPVVLEPAPVLAPPTPLSLHSTPGLRS